MAYYEYCPEHDGIEIYFDERPDEEYLSELRDNGWRWHRTKKCWYNFHSDYNEEFAEEICDTFNEEYGYDEHDEEDDSAYYNSLEQRVLSGNLIKCVDCGKGISSKAAYCINCGAPMDYIREENEKERIHRERKLKIADIERRTNGLEKEIEQLEALLLRTFADEERREKEEQLRKEREAKSSFNSNEKYQLQFSYEHYHKSEQERLIGETVKKAQRGNYGQVIEIGSDGYVNVNHGVKFLGQ